MTKNSFLIITLTYDPRPTTISQTPKSTEFSELSLLIFEVFFISRFQRIANLASICFRFSILFRFALFTIAWYLFCFFSRTKSHQILDLKAQIFSFSRSNRTSCK